jgi:hypothetical protein
MFKDYFDVTNLYVIKKLQIIYLPFLVKSEDWKPQPAIEQYYAEEGSQS